MEQLHLIIRNNVAYNRSARDTVSKFRERILFQYGRWAKTNKFAVGSRRRRNRSSPAM